MKNILDRFVDKIQGRIFVSGNFSWKSCLLWDNVEKYGKTRQTTNDNIILLMRFACWITKAADTHTENM